LIEDYGELSERVMALRTRMLERGDHLFTSTFTVGEILVKPLEQGRDDLRQGYEQALAAGATIVPLFPSTATLLSPMHASAATTRSNRPMRFNWRAHQQRRWICSSPTTTG
jgi:predicted nucleic acid-binding protein